MSPRAVCHFSFKVPSTTSSKSSAMARLLESLAGSCLSKKGDTHQHVLIHGAGHSKDQPTVVAAAFAHEKPARKDCCAPKKGAIRASATRFCEGRQHLGEPHDTAASQQCRSQTAASPWSSAAPLPCAPLAHSHLAQEASEQA